jgi:glycerophosphoryl diester phosphodiesterase
MRLSPSRLIDEAFAPAPEPRRIAPLIAHPYAHRGLHGRGVIENSRGAFRAAIAAGHGIELDVQASRDGDAFVFHDYDLDRLTEARGAVYDHDADELAAIRLSGSDETIPELSEVLDLVGGKVPLLIEIKVRGAAYSQLCYSVSLSLAQYRGPVGVMSFSPRVGRWFARHSPETLRGLVVTERGRRWRGGLSRQIAAWWARPQFLAYDVRDLPSRFAARARRRGLPVFTWTCRNAEDRARAAAHADQPIYETA